MSFVRLILVDNPNNASVSGILKLFTSFTAVSFTVAEVATRNLTMIAKNPLLHGNHLKIVVTILLKLLNISNPVAIL